MVHDWRGGTERSVCFESEEESKDGRNTNRAAGDYANESFVAQAAAREPVKSRARQRREDDQTEKIVLHNKRVSCQLLVVSCKNPVVHEACHA